MPLDIPPPPEHPLTYCLHERDLALLNQTLSRMEPALDKLAELNTNIAVLASQMNAVEHLANDINNRLTKIEINHASASGGHRWTERIVWAMVSLAIGGLLGTKL